MVLLATVAVAIVQMALVVFARNTLAAAAHEGARLAVERNQDPKIATSSVRDLVEDVVGGLVKDIDVVVEEVDGQVRVLVAGHVDTIGPLPLGIPVMQQATTRLFHDP